MTKRCWRGLTEFRHGAGVHVDFTCILLFDTCICSSRQPISITLFFNHTTERRNDSSVNSRRTFHLNSLSPELQTRNPPCLSSPPTRARSTARPPRRFSCASSGASVGPTKLMNSPLLHLRTPRPSPTIRLSCLRPSANNPCKSTPGPRVLSPNSRAYWVQCCHRES